MRGAQARQQRGVFLYEGKGRTPKRRQIMKKILFGSIAALGLAVGLVPQQASAAWAYRTVYQYDPTLGATVAVKEKYWVADTVVYTVKVRHRHRHVKRVIIEQPAVVVPGPVIVP